MNQSFCAMRWLVVAVSLTLVSVHSSRAQVSGSATGYWTDAAGNNYYGPAPVPSSSSSYSGSSYGYSSGYRSSGGLFGGLHRMFADFRARFRQRQEQDRQRRWLLAQQAEQQRLRQQAALRQNQPPPWTTSDRRRLTPVDLQRTGNTWYPLIVDLKPRALAGWVRSGDNYARQGKWDEAIRWYALAVKKFPNDPTARTRLAAAQEAKRNAAKKPSVQKPVHRHHSP